MTKETSSNPKNFRNGDVISVEGNSAPGTRDIHRAVYVKFGENYYNLSQGGQMKACRYIPPGKKEIITNLSGLGKYFLMTEEELNEAANPFATFNDEYTETTVGTSSPFKVFNDWEEVRRLSEEIINGVPHISGKGS